MFEGDFAVGFSQNPANEEAIKQISLQVKSVLRGKPITVALLFFTPHYKPSALKETINITLRPQNVFGVQVPFLIHEDTITKTGAAMCCLAPDELTLTPIFTKPGSAQKIEESLRTTLIRSKQKGRELMFSFVSPNINVLNYVQSLGLSLGRNFKVFGGGFIKKYGIKNFQVTNELIDEGANGIILGGAISCGFEKASGFVPLGRPFHITRVAHDRNVVLEINNKPAAHIYRKYLEDKFAVFKKTGFGAFYPLGIKAGKQYKIITVLDFLEDDSLFCFGEIKEGDQARIMMATTASLIDAARETASYVKFEGKYNLVILINSMTRKKILGDAAQEEIQTVKRALGKNTTVVGFYSDYQIFPARHNPFTIDNNQLCMVLL